MTVPAALILGAMTATAVLAQNQPRQTRVPGQSGQRQTVVPLQNGRQGNSRDAIVIREPRPVSTLMVNGRPASSDVDPQMIGGSMMVPIRFVAEELGANVTWDPKTRTVQLLQGNDSVTMRVGSTRASMNGEPRAMAMAPVIRKGRTLLPLRDVARFTGGIADYNSSTRTVFVTTAAGRGGGSGSGAGGGSGVGGGTVP
jgi:hypothetical protein